MPRSRRRSPIERLAVGAIVDMSTARAPSDMPSAAANSTSSTSGTSGTIVMTASAPRAASAGDSATSTPSVLRGERLGALAGPVPHGQLEARAADVRRLGPAHDPEPEEGHLLTCCHAHLHRGLDSQAIAGAERTGGLRRQLVAVQQVAAALAVRAAVGAGRRVPAALGEQRVAHVGQRLDLAHDAVAAAVLAVAAAAPAQRVLDRAQRELQLERLDRRVQRVRHRDVDRARPVRVGAGALAAADRLVVGEVVVAERQVVHRPLAERAAERLEHQVGDARAGLDVAGHDRVRRLGVQQAALGGDRPRSGGRRRRTAGRRGRPARARRSSRPTGSPTAGS